MLKITKKGSILYSYLISYMGLLLLAFVIIGTLFLSYYAKDLKRSYREMEEYKIYLAEDDLNIQLENANNVRYKIGTTSLYYPVFYDKSVTAKREMIEQLSMFKDSSFFHKEYYLCYLNRGEVYSPEGKGSELSIVMEKQWGLDNSEEILEKIAELEDVSIMKVEKNIIWVCFPVHMYTSDKDTNVVLLCKVGEEELLKYVARRANVSGERLAVYFDGELVTATVDYQPQPPEWVKSEFQVVYDFSDVSYLEHFSVFQTAGIIVILIALAVLSAVAVRESIYHTEKIRTVSRNIKGKMNAAAPENKNELMSIQETFENIYQKNEAYLVQIKRYLLRLLLAGRQLNDVQAQLKLLNIDFEEKWISVLRIRFCGNIEEDLDFLVEKIEILTEDEISYYAVYDEEKGEIIIIMALSGREQQQEGFKTVKALLVEEDVDAQLGMGTVYQEIEKVANSYLETFWEEGNTLQEGRGEPGEFIFDDKYIEKMEIAILAANYEEASMWLRKLIEKTEQVRSLLMQQCVYSNVLSMLIKIAGKLEIVLPTQQISNILLSRNQGDFFEYVDEIVNTLCSKARQDQELHNDDSIYLVKKYVQEHFLDYDLSIEKVAEEFSLSTSYLSRMFKKAAGKNWKEYIIQLRIEYAKELLEQGEKVGTVSEKIGYANVSHFIRVFKGLVGMTPAEYQNSILEET